MINLTVNEKPIELPDGGTVLDAIHLAGFNVPTLCHHPKLTPYGSCRLCLVEIEGARTLMPSCTVPAAEGMKVHTDTEKTKSARSFILSMLFSERNHFCMYCQATDGDCDLQTAAYDEGINHWTITPAYKPFYVDTSHPDFILDNNRCILCRRCVRICSELVGNNTLGLEQRGSASILIADNGIPLGESSCISCGNCVEICPTGALYDRRSMYQGRETDLTHTETVCMDCSLGCTRVVKTRDNRLVRIDSKFDDLFLGGLLCEKGRYAPLKETRQRVKEPLIRRNGELQPIAWDSALACIATQLKAYGGEEISATLSGRLPITTMQNFKSFFQDGFNLEIVGLFGHDESASVSLELAKEFGAFESRLDVIEDADAAVILGADLSNNHQVAGFMIKRKSREHFSLVEVSRDENKLGQNFIKRLIHVGNEYDEIIDLLISCKNKAAKPEAEKIIQELGLDARRANLLLDSLPDWQNPVFIIGKDYAKLSNLESLRKTIRFAQEIGAKVIILKGDTNSFAASLLGYKLNPEFKAVKVAILALADGHACHHALEALKQSEFKIVHSAYFNEFTDAADLVLPCKTWAEIDGYYLSTDGRLQFHKQSLTAEEGQHSVCDVLNFMADKTGISLHKDWQTDLTQKVSGIIKA